MYLSGKKIFLRTLESADADFLYQWENDKTNWQVSGTKKPFTKKEIKQFISNRKDIYLDKQLRLMISLRWDKGQGTRDERKNLKSAIGCIDLFDFDERNLTAGIGILIDKKHRRNGYASEALALLIRYGFEILNLNQLYCNISKGNHASTKLFQKHKFKKKEKKNNTHSLYLKSK